MSNSGEYNKSEYNPNLTPERQGTGPPVIPHGPADDNPSQQHVPSFLKKPSEFPGSKESKDDSSKSNEGSINEQIKEAASKVKQAVGSSKDEGSEQSTIKKAKEEVTGASKESQDNKAQQSKDSQCQTEGCTSENPCTSCKGQESSKKCQTEGCTSENPCSSCKDQESSKKCQTEGCTPKNPCSSCEGQASSKERCSTCGGGQESSKSTESNNLVDLILADHTKAKEIYEKYKKEDKISEKGPIAKELIKTLVAHDECEQVYLYSLMKEKLSGDKKDELYNESLKEHQELRELLYDVTQIDINKDFEKYDGALKKAMDALFDHIKLEESEVLPAIRQNTSEDELKKSGIAFKAHKPFCPTRPHPSAPQTGYVAVAGHVLLAPFDVVRDFFE